MNTTKSLLVLFVILTIAFATVSAFEYSQLSTPRTTSSSQTTGLSFLSAQPLSNSGVIQILNGSTFKAFYYIQWNSSTPSMFTIANVKFALWTNTTITNTAGSCYGAVGGYGGYVITFSDGTAERMTTCTVGPNPPAALRLTIHMNPQAGLLIFPRTGAVYFIVSS